MIICSNCTFNVLDNMKYSIVKNICPACGKNLLSENDTRILDKLKRRFAKAKFAAALNEEILHDLSFFVYNEIKAGFFDEFVVKSDVLEDSVSEPKTEDLDKIRQQIKEEVISSEVPARKIPSRNAIKESLQSLLEEPRYEDEFDNDGEEPVFSENNDPKVKRLQALYEKNKLTNPSLYQEGPSVDEIIEKNKRRIGTGKIKRSV